MILIASSIQERLLRWEQGLLCSAAVLSVRQVDSLVAAMQQAKPSMLLLDIELSGLDGPRSVIGLRRASPATQIVAATGVVSDDTELALFKAGVRGCCRNDIDPAMLGRVFTAVEQGELWIRRSITPRLLDELGAKWREESQPKRIVAGCLATLTQREREIAELIGNGESNKQIARRLLITERTVKAHLTGIFRKLGIADRLGLALQVRAQPMLEREAVS